MARGGEQVDRIKPELERRAGVLKDGASGWVDVIATSGTGKGPAVAHAVKRAFRAALPAGVLHAIADVHDVREARLIIGEALEKFADCECVGHCRLLLAITYQTSYLCQGDNPLNLLIILIILNLKTGESFRCLQEVFP